MGSEWVRVFNGLFQLLDDSGAPTYYSGSRFIGKVREIARSSLITRNTSTSDAELTKTPRAASITTTSFAISMKDVGFEFFSAFLTTSNNTNRDAFTNSAPYWEAPYQALQPK